jgi:PadR family transcriptional regulator PadR
VSDINDLQNNQILELRRGIIVLALLSQVEKPTYGYALLQSLSEGGIAVDAGTLYPLLRRLEKQGILESRWNTTDSHARKYYQLTTIGQSHYHHMRDEWFLISEKLNFMLRKE